MVLATRIERFFKSSWNPLLCGGTTLPVNLLLVAKLIVLTLLVTGHVTTLPDPFLPFLTFFNRIATPRLFQWILQSIFVIGSIATIFNRSVRLSTLSVGLTILVGIGSSRIYWANNTFFCGVILTLIGLYDSRYSLWLIRAQIALIYLGSGLNKILDPDWRSGQFFEHWAVNLEHDLYMRVAAWFPPLLLSKIMCWATICTELALMLGFSLRRFWEPAIWLGIIFHSSMTIFSGITFVLFLYVAPVAYLVFVQWPPAAITVIYDGDCGICIKTKRFFQKLDLENSFAWASFQSGIGDQFNIGMEALKKRLHLVVNNRSYQGFAAFKVMLLYNPLTYFVLLFALLTLHQGPSGARSLVLISMICFFFPLFDSFGQRVYDLVARNRNRDGANCTVD